MLARKNHAREIAGLSITANGGGGQPVSEQFLLRLFVTGASARAREALANLERICKEELEGRYELEVIDVLERPDLAEDEKVLATPTLIKRLPPPLRRVIGDLSDKEKVLMGLEVRPRTGAPRSGERAE
jgi:circadian clock protein KaiB